MILITELTADLTGNRSGLAGLKEGADVADESDHRGRNRATGRKVTPIRDIASTVYGRKEYDTPLGYSGRIALRREHCGVFTPCKNYNIETRSRDCALVDEAVFSPCRAEDSRPEPRRAEPRRAEPRRAEP
jgi:hypothetical protein